MKLGMIIIFMCVSLSLQAAEETWDEHQGLREHMSEANTHVHESVHHVHEVIHEAQETLREAQHHSADLHRETHETENHHAHDS